MSGKKNPSFEEVAPKILEALGSGGTINGREIRGDGVVIFPNQERLGSSLSWSQFVDNGVRVQPSDWRYRGGRARTFKHRKDGSLNLKAIKKAWDQISTSSKMAKERRLEEAKLQEEEEAAAKEVLKHLPRFWEDIHDPKILVGGAYNQFEVRAHFTGNVTLTVRGEMMSVKKLKKVLGALEVL